jgi:muramidase (phage lysozyme)
MPQNWWELFPEVQPSPAARPRPVGGIMPGSALGPPYGELGPDQTPPGAFDPSHFSGDARLDGSEGQITLPSHGQPRFADEDGVPTMDRNTAIQHAAAAIKRGADPSAVRARLHEMGHDEPYPPSPFSDLIPGGARELGTPPGSGDAVTDEAQPAAWSQGDSGGSLYPSNRQQDPGNLRSRADPSRAPQKVGTAKFSQSTPWDLVNNRANEIGRAAFGLVDNPSTTPLTRWQTRRRNENAAIAGNPRIRAFLDAIALAEGNTGYDSLYGNHHQTFRDRSRHPGNVGQNGGGAAGRYQFLPNTYRDLNNRLGHFSMSDSDQDQMAIELIRERGALPLILSGNPADFDEAVSRLGRHRIWASFPILENGVWRPNPSGQRTEDIGNIRARFNQSLARGSRRGLGVGSVGLGVAGDYRGHLPRAL